MKIIRRGQIPAKRTHRVTCMWCDTLFEFQEIEAEKVYDQRDGSYFKIQCPVCRKEITA